jgi:hypothetical protein
MKLIKYVLSVVFLAGLFVSAHSYPVNERPEKVERVERPEKVERVERPEMPTLEVSDDGQELELELENDQIKVTIEINPADGTVHTSKTRTRHKGGK